MLTPLYAIDSLPATITVVAPGAAQSDTVVPIVPTTVGLDAGFIVDFGTTKFARLSIEALVGDGSLTVDPLPTALIAGDVATIPGSPAASLLSQTYVKLDAAAKTAQHLLAEQLLDLRAPLYTGDDAEELAFAIVLQVNFQALHGITPGLVRSTASSRTGDTTTYRDRYVDPEARRIVERVTGVRQVRYEPFGAGV